MLRASGCFAGDVAASATSTEPEVAGWKWLNETVDVVSSAVGGELCSAE